MTVVEFSDFECPFCKRFAESFDELPPAERRNVRTVFKQRPLAMHPWARHAALISICASLQGGDTFWRLERFLFANQATIRADNLDEKVETFGSQTSPSLDLARLRSCLISGSAERVLARDERLAELYHVDATPTVFINGTRKAGMAGLEKLRTLLDAAR